MYISLLRGAAYCAHPILDRQLLPENRYVKRIDQCEHTYSFRIAVAKREELERMALEFNQKPFVQNVFPTALNTSKEAGKTLVIENKNIALVTMKKSDEQDGYVIRLMNNAEQLTTTKVVFGNESIELKFGKYEVKTIIYNNGFKECNQIII